MTPANGAGDGDGAGGGPALTAGEGAGAAVAGGPGLTAGEGPGAGAAGEGAGAGEAGQRERARALLASPEFKALVARRWAVSFALLALLFVSYYGYILLIATSKAFVSRKVGEVTTLAIPLGVAVIVVAWALTAAYVAWANRAYDPEVERLKGKLRRGPEGGAGGAS